MLTTLRHAALSALLLVSVGVLSRQTLASGSSMPGIRAASDISAVGSRDIPRSTTHQPAPDPKPPQPATPPPATPVPGGKPGGPPATDTAKLINVKFVTTAGDIFVELNNEKAPISVKNFLAYVDKKAYDGTIFHRVIADFVIQGGGYTKDLQEVKGDAPIKNEWQNGLKNLRGSIGMARDAEPDTATREFYFNTNDNAKLDNPREQTGNAGYAVFGKAVAGMAVIDKIRMGKTHVIPHDDPSKIMRDVPDEPVTITTVVRITEAEARKAVEAEPAVPSTPAPPPIDPSRPPEKKDEKPKGEPPANK